MLAIVNPAAGGGRAARIWARLQLQIDCAATQTAGHARTLAREAAAQGFERVLAVGGDGTVSEVATGLADSDAALAVIPAGTGNDYARALGLPREPAAAARVALEATTRLVDRGWIENAHGRSGFVSVAGCGFDAEVVRTMGAQRTGHGALTYLFGVLRALAGVRPRSLRLELDGSTAIERAAVGIAVAIAPSYGGGLRVAPRAVIDDGLFEVCLVGALAPAAIIGLLPFLYLGAHRLYPGVEFFRCREVSVRGEAGCQADGELAGALPARFSIQPRALRVVAP